MSDVAQALERAYLDIVTLLNYGDFKRNVTWDAGYLLNAIAIAKGEPPPHADEPVERNPLLAQFEDASAESAEGGQE